ncbi:MAG: hypothetical protein K6T16_01525 [Candidatus Pacearchaeota archaeon]|nr:hypothetical protein [Candidatus Pacearchaeota archaeon]
MSEKKRAPTKWTTLAIYYGTLADLPIDYPSLINIDNTFYNTFSRMFGWDGNNWRRLKVNKEGKIEASFAASDIQIGAVEIKDHATETRANVLPISGVNALSVLAYQNNQANLLTTAYQGGSWTTGRTWTLNSATDSVTSIHITAPYSSTALAPTFATVGTSSTQVVPSNPNRKGLVLINTSANQISIAFGANPAVLNSGITLNANGGTYVMDSFTFTTASVNAIASAADSNLAIQEFT